MFFLWPAAGTARCAVNSILHFLGEKQTEKPFSDFVVYLDPLFFRTMWTFIRAGLDTSGANFSAVLQPKLINWVYGGLKLNTNTNQV